MAQTTQVAGGSTYGMATIRRPGWVTFAASISFVVGAFYILAALSEFANSYWIYSSLPANVYSIAGSHLFWWGIFDSIIGVIAIIAGFSMLRGGVFGFTIGLTGAGLSALRWLFYISHDPWLAITIIGLDALVIYGLAASVEYFVGAE